MSHPADRNLLLGLLALQMNFITSDAWLATMRAWTSDTARTLEEMLIERGALDPADLDALRSVVDRQLARHGGDPTASIAAITRNGSLLETIGLVGGRDSSSTLIAPDLILTTTQNHEPSGHRGEPNASDDRSLRYHRVRFHASGNLGEVFVAHDDELHREVALKQLKGPHADDPGSRSRFFFEAEVTGGLEHPGIVPVYGLGRYDDGRPFYAMRFIKGTSLAEAIEAFHSSEARREASGVRLLALQKLLRRFLDVCNAVAYAHSRGILHRDLKPSNIMVGKYGETLVVDWGLARPIASHDAEAEAIAVDEPPIQARSWTSGSGTVAGTVIGTPTYMAPEQAAGRLDLLGPRSDVYSLGATLYHLLTGQGAFRGNSLSEVLNDVQQGAYPPPRAVEPSIPKALDAITRKAMALRAEDRYATPLEMATDIEHWLADEPISAMTDRRVDRLARWVRNHRSASLSAAAAVVALAVTATLAAVFVAAAERTTSKALDKAREANIVASRATAEARAEADKATSVSEFLVGLFEETDPVAAAGRSLGIAGRSGNALTAREVIDRGASAIAGKFRDQPLIRAAMLDSIGNVYVGLGAIDQAEPLLVEALAIRERELPADSLDLASSLHSLGYARQVRLDPSCTSLFRRALAIRLNRLGTDDLRVASTQFHLGMALTIETQGENDESRRLLDESLATRRRSPTQTRRELAIQLILMGYLETAKENQVKAAALFVEAGKLLSASGDPALSEAILILAKAHAFETLVGETMALKSYAATVERAERLLGPDHLVTFYLRATYAEKLQRARRYPEAETLYRTSLEIARRLQYPDEATVGLVVELARTVRDGGNPTEGERIGREAIAIARRCRRQTPNTRRLIAHSSFIVGVMASNRGDHSEETLTLLRDALKIRREIFDPRNHILADTYRTLGGCFENAGPAHRDEAISYYNHALEIVRLNPGWVPDWLKTVETSLARLKALPPKAPRLPRG